MSVFATMNLFCFPPPPSERKPLRRRYPRAPGGVGAQPPLLLGVRPPEAGARQDPAVLA